MNLQFCKDCDIVLSEISKNQNSEDSSPINMRLKFIDVCKNALTNNDVKYIRAIHYELFTVNDFLSGVNPSNLDQVYNLNTINNKGFNFYKLHPLLNNI